jgi:PAS domain S-box-containing protein
VRVLIIDDELALAELAKDFIGSLAGMGAEISISAAKGLEMMRAQAFDALVCDYQMPVMDGLSLLKLLRGNGNDIPFILFTGRGREEVVIEALNSGADFYLQKGGNPAAQFTELAHMIRVAVERKRATEALRTSESRLNLALEGASEGLWDLDLRTGEAYLSPRFHAILGFETGGLPNKWDAWVSMIHADDREKVLAEMRGALAAGKAEIRSEYRIRNSGGEYSWILAKGKAIGFSEGKAVRLVGTISDITERKQMELAMSEMTRRLRDFVDNAPLGTFQTSVEGRILDANPALARMMGYASPRELMDEITDLATQVYLDPVDRREVLRQLRETDGWVRRDMTWRRKDGLPLEIEMTARRVPGPTGEIAYFEGFMVETTDRHRMESELRKLAQAVEQSPALIVITDPVGRIEWVNPRFTQTTGYELEEVRGQNPRILKSGETSEEEYRQLWQTVLGGGIWRGEFHNRKKDGTLYWESASISPVFVGGVVSHLVAIKEDITDLKSAREELAHRQSNYWAVLDSAGLGLGFWDLQGNLIFFNAKAAANMGGVPDDFVGKNIVDLFGPEGGAVYLERIRLASASASAMEYEDGVPLPIGVSWFLSVYTRVTGADGRLIGVQVLSHDITDRKMAEQALQEAEEKYRILLHDSVDPIFVVRPDGTYVYVNRTFAEGAGYPAEDIIGRTMWDIFPKEVADTRFSYLEKALTEGEATSHEMRASIHGREQIFLSTVTPIKDERGQVVSCICIAKDITARKLAEEEVRLRDEERTIYLDHSPDAFFVVDASGHFLEVNSAAERMSGYGEAEILGLGVRDLAGPEMQERVPAIRKQLREKGSFTLETEMRRKDGTLVAVLLKAVTLPDGRMMAFVTDLSSICEARVAREAIEVQYRALFENAPIGIFRLSPEGRFRAANPELAAMLGLSSTVELMRGGANIERLFLDKERYLTLSAMVREGTWVRGMADWRRQDGRVIEVNITWRGVLTDEGMSVEGFVEDVTKRVAAEEESARNEQRYRSVTENANEGIVVAQDGLLRFINPRICEMVQAEPQDILEKDFAHFVHPADREMVVRHHRDRGAGKAAPSRYDFRVLGNKGGLTWVTVSVVSFTWDGRPATLNFLIDITERKAVEDALRKANRNLTLMNSLTRHDVLNQIMAIRGLAQILEWKSKAEEGKDMLRRIEKAAIQVQEQMEFARLYQEIGAQEPAWQSVFAAVRKAGSGLPLVGLEIITTGADREVLADPMFAKVAYTMVENCLRHSGATKLEVSCLENGRELLVMFADDGRGVTAEERERLFERGIGRNTGFGLYLSREVLAISGMTIEEVSRDGQGARFQIAVPDGKWR